MSTLAVNPVMTPLLVGQSLFRLPGSIASHPVVRRLVRSAENNRWCDEHELLKRLDQDRARLRTMFSGSFEQVAAIEVIGDPHDGMRTAKVVTFDDGSKLMYKPRDLQMHAAWADFVGWMNARSEVQVAVPRCLSRSTHGWVEYISSELRTSADDEKAFHQSAGALLCLLYLFRANDCRKDSVVDTRQSPVLVDVETLFQPASLELSIFDTGFLPSPEVGAGGLRYMRAHVDSVLQGFAAMYQGAVDHREALLSDDGPLGGFAGAQTRVSVRCSSFYRALFDSALHEEYLCSEQAFNDRFEALLRRYPCQFEGIDDDMLSCAELEALTSMDVPIFQVSTESGMAASRKRIAELCERDLRLQLARIQASFQASAVHLAGGTGAVIQPDFGDEATRIGDQLLGSAVSIGDSELDWIGVEYGARSERYVARVIGHDLRDGRCGIALFFAALYRATHDERYQAAALNAFSSTLQLSDDEAMELGIGGGTGLGSLVYAVSRAAQWLDSNSLRQSAERLAKLITADLLAADREYDVMAGAAGCILGLLTLRELRPAVTACARHLQQNAEPRFQGSAWPGPAPQPATGFAHGASGIAYALYRLYERTQDESLLATIADALAYETGLYSAEQKNWFDVRALMSPNQPLYGRSWCHGAPGIGLARCGLAGVAPAEDLHNALSYVRSASSPDTDHLCCGHFGWIELLLVASQRLEDASLRSEARDRAASVLRRAREKGGYSFGPDPSATVSAPGLFTGLAGIGYSLLRLEDSTLPSVLLWQ